MWRQLKTARDVESEYAHSWVMIHNLEGGVPKKLAALKAACQLELGCQPKTASPKIGCLLKTRGCQLKDSVAQKRLWLKIELWLLWRTVAKAELIAKLKAEIR
jgi:hypothetical protein